MSPGGRRLRARIPPRRASWSRRARVLRSGERRNEMPRRLLIVVTAEVADGALRDLVRSRGGDDAETLVVAPASEISRLDWLKKAAGGARGGGAALGGAG